MSVTAYRCLKHNILIVSWKSTAKISEETGIPTGAVNYNLNELVVLDLVEKKSRESKGEGEDRRSDSFRVRDEWYCAINELTPTICICDDTDDIIIDQSNANKEKIDHTHTYKSLASILPQAIDTWQKCNGVINSLNFEEFFADFLLEHEGIEEIATAHRYAMKLCKMTPGADKE